MTIPFIAFVLWSVGVLILGFWAGHMCGYSNASRLEKRLKQAVTVGAINANFARYIIDNKL